MTPPVISIENASKQFGSFRAVDAVSMSVAPGEVVGLLGANGAGKTTLIRMVLGLLHTDGGQVLLFGAPPSHASRQRLGYVPQGLGLYDDLTVGENLDFVARAFGRQRTQPSDAGVAAALDESVGSLPLGLKRRTAFAAALAHEPELLVLDEPTSGVDPLARAQLWDLIGAAASGGAGVLVSTHYMEEAQNCDRLVVMRAGRVVAEGTVANIIGSRVVVAATTHDLAQLTSVLDTKAVDYVPVGGGVRIINASADGITELLAASRVSASLTQVPATFEEAFVQLVGAASL